MTAHLTPVPRADAMKRVAERAPIWIIAVAGHLLLAVVFGMIYVRHETRASVAREHGTMTVQTEPDQKLEDPIVIELPRDFKAPPDAPDPDPRDFKVPPDAARLDPPGDDNGSLGRGGMTSPEPDARGSGTNGEPSELTGTDLAGLGPGRGGPASRGIPGAGAANGHPRITRIYQSPNFQKAEPIVKGGLRWLRDHQSDDGSWGAAGFHLKCDPKLGAECTGRGDASFDVGVTGLALLAFLGAGHGGGGTTPNDEAVKRALKWLRGCQDAEGCFGPRGDRFTYSHACATIAMCEAATFNRSVAAWKKSAQAAIDFIERSQNPGKGWRYGVQGNDSDASVTGWMLLALKAGKDAGLVVEDRSIRQGLSYLDALTEEGSGRTGYQRRGDLPVRPQGMVDRWPARESESLTAVATCARIFCGDHESGFMRDAENTLAKKQPVWDESAGSIDMYYWYYGTLAMHQLGGASWDQWNKSLEKAVIRNQIKDGCAEGSWDPKDPWGVEGGRVYSTALMTLCFEVYWRYPLVFGGRK